MDFTRWLQLHFEQFQDSLLIFFWNGDLVEFNAVEFDSPLADGLESLQHVGEAPAPIFLGAVLREQRSRALFHVPLQVIGQQAQKHMAANAPIQLVW